MLCNKKEENSRGSCWVTQAAQQRKREKKAKIGGGGANCEMEGIVVCITWKMERGQLGSGGWPTVKTGGVWGIKAWLRVMFDEAVDGRSDGVTIF